MSPHACIPAARPSQQPPIPPAPTNLQPGEQVAQLAGQPPALQHVVGAALKAGGGEVGGCSLLKAKDLQRTGAQAMVLGGCRLKLAAASTKHRKPVSEEGILGRHAHEFGVEASSRVCQALQALAGDPRTGQWSRAGGRTAAGGAAPKPSAGGSPTPGTDFSFHNPCTLKKSPGAGGSPAPCTCAAARPCSASR